MKKKLTMVVSLLLVMALSIGGTLAYLTAESETITNTFTIGNIEISLAETTGTTYTVVPGATVDKNPTVTVKKGSEACWLYACVENNVQVTVEGKQVTVAELNIGADWKEVATKDNKTLYRYTEAAVAANADADQDFGIFTTVTFDGDKITAENRADITDADTIVVKAFAHQSAEVGMTAADTAAKNHFGF